jgi:YfiH family protein
MAASFLTANNLSAAGYRHAFFTRQGGHSPRPFDSLHFGAAGHTEHELAANVDEAARALGIDPAALYTATQVHGRDVLAIEPDRDRAKLLGQHADALLAHSPGLGCAVKIADCLPVLLAHRDSGAVAAVHSGWQGTVRDVVGAAVAALCRTTGQESGLIAAIGPHIRACCFEVGDDVAAQLAAAAGSDDVVRRASGARPHVDLALVVKHQLRRAGVLEPAIEILDGCSMCDAARFFSYRRDRENSGRNLAAIVAGRAGSPDARDAHG